MVQSARVDQIKSNDSSVAINTFYISRREKEISFGFQRVSALLCSASL